MLNAKVLGLIPARGNSKGIHKKNITPLHGKPLISWVCEEAKKSENIDRLILSSDNDEIIDVVKKYGIEAPFKRPASISEDRTPIIEVIAHALKWFQAEQNEHFTHVCLIQPTCPLGKVEYYDAAIRTAVENDADTVISVYPCGQEHPSIMYTLNEGTRADWFVKGAGWDRMARRQDLPPVYMRSGIVYVFRSSMILETNNLYGERIYTVQVSPERAIDINTHIDLKLAEVLIDELG